MLLQNAAPSQKKIVLSEGSDPRVVQAAIDARKQGIARIVLVGPEQDILGQNSFAGAKPDDGVEIHDPVNSPLLDELALAFFERRKHKGVSLEDAICAARKPHVYAALLVKTGRADGTVGGAVATTAEIVRTAIQVIGTKPGSKVLLPYAVLPNPPHKKGRSYLC